MDRINLYFHNCELGSVVKSRISANIGFYLGKAPSDASTCCCISQKNEHYTCNMRVHSAQGHLHIHRESKSLETLLNFVYDSLKRSLDQWHKDPQRYKNSHPMGASPCRDQDHNVVHCPYKSYANKKFENKE